MCFWNWAFFGEAVYLECICGLRSVQRSGDARQASNFGGVGLAFQRQRRTLKLARFVAGSGCGTGTYPVSFQGLCRSRIMSFVRMSLGSLRSGAMSLGIMFTQSPSKERSRPPAMAPAVLQGG